MLIEVGQEDKEGKEEEKEEEEGKEEIFISTLGVPLNFKHPSQ